MAAKKKAEYRVADACGVDTSKGRQVFNAVVSLPVAEADVINNVIPGALVPVETKE